MNNMHNVKFFGGYTKYSVSEGENEIIDGGWRGLDGREKAITYS